MVRWILGTAGTGKTSRALEEAGAAARAGQKVLLLVPEQYSLEMEKNGAARAGHFIGVSRRGLQFYPSLRQNLSGVGRRSPASTGGSSPLFGDAFGVGTAQRRFASISEKQPQRCGDCGADQADGGVSHRRDRSADAA